MKVTELLIKGLKQVKENEELVFNLNNGKDLDKADFVVSKFLCLPCLNQLNTLGIDMMQGVFGVRCKAVNTTKIVFATEGNIVRGIGAPPKTMTVPAGRVFVLSLFELMLNVCKPPYNLSIKVEGSENNAKIVPVDSIPEAIYPNITVKWDGDKHFNFEITGKITKGYIVFEDNTIPRHVRVAGQDLYTRLFPDALYERIEDIEVTRSDQMNMFKQAFRQATKAAEPAKVYSDEQKIALAEYAKLMGGGYGAV